MPIFITQGRYTQDAIKGMIANPEDRAEAVAELARQAGGRMLAYYVTAGEYDFMVIIDMPGPREAATAVLTAAASGGVTDLKTTFAMTSAEAKEVFAGAGKLASSFRAAGRS
ncbi:MAG TPA: GYD domain-containing protein [Geminicoccaceae bacterium]|nr:GYD domain-containing protein [Geminicoccaceae bacterium]